MQRLYIIVGIELLFIINYYIRSIIALWFSEDKILNNIDAEDAVDVVKNKSGLLGTVYKYKNIYVYLMYLYIYIFNEILYSVFTY